MTTCPHTRLSADVHIRGAGDAPRDGTLTVRCADCGAPFALLAATADRDAIHFRTAPPQAPIITIAASVPEGPLSYSGFKKLMQRLSGKAS